MTFFCFDILAVEYETSLERSPNRFNSLYGAGYAAELAGDQAKASQFYQQLVEGCAHVGSRRERL